MIVNINKNILVEMLNDEDVFSCSNSFEDFELMVSKMFGFIEDEKFLKSLWDEYEEYIKSEE